MCAWQAAHIGSERCCLHLLPQRHRVPTAASFSARHVGGGGGGGAFRIFSSTYLPRSTTDVRDG